MTDRPPRLEPTLPKDSYLSGSWYQDEMERIFRRDWVLVGRGESIPAPGDYRHLTIAGESLLMVRGADRRIRVFHNVCRHRGCELVLASEMPAGAVERHGAHGQCGHTIRCPYHGWTYQLDGSLRTAPFLEEAVAERRDEFGLYQAAVAEWGGFVFIHLGTGVAGAAGSFETQIAGARVRLRNYPLADLRIGERRVYQVAANWKVILENYNECYHCAGVHPELCRVVPAFKQNGGASLDWDRGVPHRDGAVTFTTSGTTNRAPFPGLDADELVRHKGELIYPNMMISLSMDHVSVYTVMPVDPGLTTVINDFLFHPDEMAKPGFDGSDAVEFWDLINRQDWAICEGVQRGMASSRFHRGYYAPMESASLDIRRYVARRLDRPDLDTGP